MGSFNYGKIRTMGAVLVAISIPIFTSQLEKAREATDAANLRAAYAECSAAALTETANSANQDASKGVVVTVDNSTKVVTCTRKVTLKQAVSGWVTEGDIAGITLGTTSTIPSSGTVIVTVKSDGSAPTFTDK